MNQNLLYYKCSLYEQEIDDVSNFSFTQEELLLKKSKEISNTFQKIKVIYKFSFYEYNNADWKKPTGIITIKNNANLLQFTLQNLQEYEIFKYVNFIIVDDRSTEQLKNITDKYPVSYLRVDNDKGFNFSALNNIAAKIAYDKGSKDIILWNSDLWTKDKNTVPRLLELHEANGSTISGTKLIYPPFSWNGEKTSDNIKNQFPNKLETYRNTIQFGGSYFIQSQQFLNFFPIHRYRFCNIDHHFANENKLESFVTGAFQIINLNWFIANGGLNQSLSKNFQDVDICLRAIEANKKVFYFGKDLFLFHDESVILSKNKNDDQLYSDHILYSKIWSQERFVKTIIGN